jgi:anti-sigma factor RsiW
LVIFSPVERVSREVIPASTPTTRSVGGAWATVVSTRIDTCHRPAGSRDTVTADGSAPSGNGRDHTMSNGPSIFANVNRPSLQRNADRVYSTEALPRLRDLNLG